jgi:outer membrane lipoprotein-sorting protein
MNNHGLRWVAGLCLVLTLAAGACAAEKPLTAESPLDDVLDALDVRGKTLQDFSADVQWKNTEVALGSFTTWKGTIRYQSPPGQNGRLHVLFVEHVVGKRTYSENGKPILEYLLDEGWLTTRDYKVPSQVRQQVAKPGQKINLLKLGEGPFPLPIGQDKKDVHDQFEVQIIPADKADPPATIHLQFKPKPESLLARRFKIIDTWVDLKLSMPIRIETLDPNEAKCDQTDLSNIQINTGLKDKDFDLPPIDSKWSQRDEPFAQ